MTGYDAHHREGTGSEDEDSDWSGENQEEDEEEEEEPRSEMMQTLMAIDSENVSNVLKKLDSIRQLAGDAQVLRRKENKEQNTRRLHIAQIHSLLLEEAEFNPQAVRQRNVLAMLEGIKLSHAEIFFFSVDESRKKLSTGPSVKLRDAIARPYRYADRLLVDSDVLSRMFTELSTYQILDIVNKGTEYLTYKQTTYQVKPIEEKDSFHVRNASGIAVWKNTLLVVDSVNHCIWCVATSKLTAQGSHEVEIYAGIPRQPGEQDGALLEARFRGPTGIVVSDRSQEAFIADSDNNAIRIIDLKTQMVSTIRLIISPMTTEVFGASFAQPKGICVINGDKHMFHEMESCQQKQAEEYKAHMEALRQMKDNETPVSSERSSSWHSQSQSEQESKPSQEDDNDDSIDDDGEDYNEDSEEGEEESSSLTESSSQVTSESSVSSSDIGSSERGNSRNKSRNQQTRGQSAHVDKKNHRPPAVASYGEQLSLEQSLSYERMKKYVVLQDTVRPPRPSIARPVLRSGSLAPADGLPVSRAHSRDGMSVSGTLSSRRQSACDAIRDVENEHPVMEVRLAVTCDHCVWYLNPQNGKTHIIAGHPYQYGYCDASLGMAGRFSSPKGVINVRSILFIADYWNNVIRTINLWTTRVDTVVDFAPQGPMAIGLSNSGVMYTLDSDEIHYTNILRIMSTQRNDDGGSISTPNPADDRAGYAALFSQPRTRASSVISESTYITKKSEVWDTYKQNQSKAKHPIANPGETGGPEFKRRLEEHLKDAARERVTKFKKTGRAKRREIKKNKTKKRKKKRREKEKTENSAPMRPEDDPMYIDPRLLQGCEVVNIQISTTNGESTQVSSQHGSYSKAEDEDSEEEGSSDHSDDLDPLAQALKEQLQELKQNEPADDEQAGSVQGFAINPSGKSSLTTDPLKKKKSPRMSSKSPDSQSQAQDHVELMKQRLTNTAPLELSRRGSLLQASPMTLSDLGVAVANDHGMTMPRGSWKGSGQTTISVPVSETNAGVGSAMVYQNQSWNNGQYRMMACDDRGSNVEEVPNPDAGTVMVSGGKAFYRSTSTTWSEYKVASSSAPSVHTSRRGSIVTDASGTGNRMQGEDENGKLVNFVVRSALVNDDDPDVQNAVEDSQMSLQVEKAAQKLLQPLRGSLRTGGSEIPSRLNSARNSRRPSVSFAKGEETQYISKQQKTESAVQPPGPSEKRHSHLMRRASLPNIEAFASKRRSSVEQVSLSRRGSESRRGSMVFTENDLSDMNMAHRGSVGDRRNSLVGSRRNSLRIGEGEQPPALVNMNMNRRRSILDRRSSFSMNIMPTVLDQDEKVEEGSASGDSDKGSKASKQSLTSKAGSKTKSGKSDTAESSEKSRSDIRSSSARSDPEKKPGVTDRDETTSTGSAGSSGKKISPSKSSTTLNDVSQELSTWSSEMDEEPTSPKEIVSLASLPFTRDIDLDTLQEKLDQNALAPTLHTLSGGMDDSDLLQQRRRTTLATSTFGTYKITAAPVSKTWRSLPLPEPLSSAHRNRGGRKYPNTPLSIAWYESNGENCIFVGLYCWPNLLKIIPPKHHEPDKPGRFNVLPIDSQRVLLADDSSHQIWLFNHQHSIIKHLAGCGKRGYLDGPLETCRMHSPCALTIDPRSHFIYVADRGNHVIRKIDLMSGLMSTAAGNGTRGNTDGANPMRQALDSPFEVSFAEPHFLLISCADNSIRSFNLKNNFLETILVGS